MYLINIRETDAKALRLRITIRGPHKVLSHVGFGLTTLNAVESAVNSTKAICLKQNGVKENCQK